jgi:hypothetical protein
MADCLQCPQKTKEIAELKSRVQFHQKEELFWRTAFNEQRGGDVYTEMQSQLGGERVENGRLRKQLKDQQEAYANID